SQTLHAICESAERQWENVRAMVLLSEGERHEIAAAPRLSANFVLSLDALLTSERALPGDGESVTIDITTDPRWKPLHEAAARESVQACNHIPIVAGNSKQIGVLALFHEKCLAFDDHSAKAMQSLASLCGL